MTTIAVYNIKGGVGKTAAAVNLSYYAAAAGLRVLVWDLDPQASASFYFRIKPRLKGARKRIQSAALGERIKGTDFVGLDLLPSDFRLRNMELLLAEAKKPERVLAKSLRPLVSEYDLILLDCPPGISLFAESIFHAADMVLMPVVPTTLSQRTLLQVAQFIEQEGIDVGLRAFISMLDRRKSLQREAADSLALRSEMLQSIVPYASEVERMGIERAPLPVFAPRCPAAVAFAALWEELRRQLQSTA